MVQNEHAALPSSEDLELLAGLFRTESLRDAAAALRISNSTASRRLAEMRTRFSDPLFVRSGSRLLPTPRMKEIAARLFPLLDSLEHFYDSKAFEPSRSRLKGQFRILITDNNFLNILAPVLPRISREAPQLELEVMPLRRNGMWQLISGKANLAIYAFPEYRREIRAAPLEKDRYCLLLRRDHPAARLWLRQGELTLGALSPYTQIMNPRFSRTLRDPCGYERGPGQKRLYSPFFNTNPALLLESDFVQWTLESAARRAIDATEDELLMIPARAFTDYGPTDTVTSLLLWAARSENDPLSQWMRSIIIGAAKEKNPGGTGLPLTGKSEAS